jgi:hypothetical protein
MEIDSLDEANGRGGVDGMTTHGVITHRGIEGAALRIHRWTKLNRTSVPSEILDLKR